jgi:pimeloyl-ACP methyl ester carboxylesterase
LAVPESRDRDDTRPITIAFTIVPASDADREEDPLLILLGGPGDAASRRPGELVRAHAESHRWRDLVLVDQRGTGQSSPLECRFGTDDDLQSYLNAFMPAEPVHACRRALGANADLARYRTRDFVADLEALRAALGVRRWNLHGTSYGTRVALHYMMRHPGSIRSAVLAGVASPDLVMPVPFGEDADRAIGLLVADCLADSACGAAFPRFAEEIDSIVARLNRASAQTTVVHPVTGRRVTVRLTRDSFGEFMRATMYTALGAAALPNIVHQAYGGDFTAIAESALRRQRGLARAGLSGLYLAVTCTEDLPRSVPATAIAANRGTILGTARAEQHAAACTGWPVREDGEEWPSSQRVRTPVLMLVGEADPVTPPRWAESAARIMDRSRLVVVPGGGHGFAGMTGGDCIERLVAEFLDRPMPAELDASCAGQMGRPPFDSTLGGRMR